VALIRLVGDEWYPVYEPDPRGNVEVEVADDVLARWLAVIEEFKDVQDQIADAVEHGRRVERKSSPSFF
jgi:hypothetical protein